ncbi:MULTISPECIES: hypothetical protein [unclassified Streptomyces]|uniref:hypothetical protein n=1 Tax=unclassified Streptomyces TaxID=2593676 RepID=UPI00133184C4|nr:MULTISPECIES: hypothetical protein [unclassified Streptomyces]MCP3766531.1 hypothetical protein [Streptomyces sp. MAR25Y5]
MRWETWGKLRLAFTPLDKPVVFGGTVVHYDYDPRIMTRELAAFGARVDRVEELVLSALRELGYLDEKGRALLPQGALVRNTIERAQKERPPTEKIRGAIERLLSRGVLTWEQGSVDGATVLHYPARTGETPVPLLCYAPMLRVASRAFAGLVLYSSSPRCRRRTCRWIGPSVSTTRYTASVKGGFGIPPRRSAVAGSRSATSAGWYGTAQSPWSGAVREDLRGATGRLLAS